MNVGPRVSDFLTLDKMEEIATGIGYNLDGNYLPGEFDYLVLEATDVALRHLDSPNYEPALMKALKIEVHSEVKDRFAKVCRVPQVNINFPELDIPGAWRYELHTWCRWLCF